MQTTRRSHLLHWSLQRLILSESTFKYPTVTVQRSHQAKSVISVYRWEATEGPHQQTGFYYRLAQNLISIDQKLKKHSGDMTVFPQWVMLCDFSSRNNNSRDTMMDGQKYFYCSRQHQRWVGQEKKSTGPRAHWTTRGLSVCLSVSQSLPGFFQTALHTHTHTHTHTHLFIIKRQKHQPACELYSDHTPKYVDTEMHKNTNQQSSCDVNRTHLNLTSVVAEGPDRCPSL